MTTREQTALQKQLETIIFGTTTPAGRAFDLSLLALILASVAVVMLDSVEPYHDRHGLLFARLELGFTLVFTLEYLVRIWCTRNRGAYVTSFWGVVDLLAVLPTYVALMLSLIHISEPTRH